MNNLHVPCLASKNTFKMLTGLRETCNDAEMANLCFTVCDQGWHDCLDLCTTDDYDCNFQCHQEQSNCTDNCPCMSNCPDGCVECGFCVCYDIESNDDFVTCRDNLEDEYLSCLSYHACRSCRVCDKTYIITYC